MTIRTPSLSDLVISPVGAGSVSDTRSLGDGPTSSGLFSTGPAATSGELGSILSELSTVYDYDSTVYDTEITGSGATSAYPLILATLPMTNLYSGGKETNTSILLEIQNDLRSETAKKAESIVAQYYTMKPAVSGTLAALRDANISKYNTLVSSISEIARLRDDIVNAADNPSASENQQNIVDSSASTTSADAVATSSVVVNPVVEIADLATVSLATQSGLSSAFSTIGLSNSSNSYGNDPVSYVDDDVTKYDNGKNVSQSLTENLLGITSTDDQTRTARQYQLFKAAWSQIQNGRNLSDSTGVYSDLDYVKVASISDAADLSKKALVTGKGFLEVAGAIVSNGYMVDASTSDSGDAILSDLSQKGIYYAGRIKFINESIAENYLIPASINDDDVFIDKSTNFYDPEYISNGYDNLPVVGMDINSLTGDVVNQFAPVLANLIMEAALGPVSLPSALDPSYDKDVKVRDTYQDSLKYIARNSQNENIFLFDDSLTGDLKDKATPISTILTAGIQDVSSIQTQVESIYDNLETFVSDNRAFITNQCALTILNKFYTDMLSYFSDSSLFSDSNGDGSAFRCALFARASTSSLIAAKLFRFLQDQSTIGWVGYAGTSSLTTADMADGIVATLSFTDEADFTVGGTRINTSLGLEKRSFDNGSGGQTTADFFSSMFDGTSFAGLQDLISSLSVNYPIIATNPKLQAQIQLAYYYTFLFILKNLYCQVGVSLEANPDSAAVSDGKSDYTITSGTSSKLIYSGYLRRSKPDIAFLNDVLSEVFTTTSASDLSFAGFTELVGNAPDEQQTSTGSALFFKPLRSKISYLLQVYQDFRSLIAYQLTILRSQSSNLSRIISLYEKISDQFDGDSSRAAKLISRYLTLESVTEALYRSTRYQTFIPDTNISSIMMRSRNYRTIVRAAFKSLIPSKENLKICVVGLPYGFLERLRLAQEQREYYFGVTLNTDVIQNFDDPYVEVDYKFNFVNNSLSYRPNLAGPYSSQIANLYDDFESTEVVSSTSNDNIKILQLSSDGKKLDVLKREDATDTFKAIDFPATIVQAALQSYIEDLYGLYPRFASTKSSIDPDSFDELKYAELALKALGYNQDDEENSLVYNRLQAAIMMHRDFITSRMLAEFEASPVFDKIVYMVVDGNVLPDIITQFYCKVGV